MPCLHLPLTGAFRRIPNSKVQIAGWIPPVSKGWKGNATQRESVWWVMSDERDSTFAQGCAKKSKDKKIQLKHVIRKLRLGLSLGLGLG